MREEDTVGLPDLLGQLATELGPVAAAETFEQPGLMMKHPFEARGLVVGAQAFAKIPRSLCDAVLRGPDRDFALGANGLVEQCERFLDSRFARFEEPRFEGFALQQIVDFLGRRGNRILDHRLDIRLRPRHGQGRFGQGQGTCHIGVGQGLGLGGSHGLVDKARGQWQGNERSQVSAALPYLLDQLVHAAAG